MIRTIFLLACSLFAAFAAPPHLVLVSGDHEYSGEETLPWLAKILEKDFGLKTTVLFATKPDGSKDENYEKSIPGLEALATADAAVFFLRWRQLPAEQVAHIQKFIESGKPAVAFRTTSHGFKYPAGDALERWNSFGEFAFGTPPGWGANGHTHCGHKCSTDVSVIGDAAADPILTGVAKEFHVTSWLYHVPGYPPIEAKRLLLGHAVNPNKPMPDNPVAWTWKNKWGGKVFYTSLGHPDDFQVESVQRLAINSILWSLGKPVPTQWKGPYPLSVKYHGLQPTKP